MRKTGYFAGTTPSLDFIHAFLVWVIAWWAFVLAMPGDTFATNRIYHLFTAVMAESQWAGALAIVACWGAAGLYFRPLRIASIHVLCLTHATLAALLFIPNPIGTGSGVYAGLAVAGYYLLWRQGKADV